MTGYYNFTDHINTFCWLEASDKYYFRYDGAAFPSYYMNIRNAELRWNHLKSFSALNEAITTHQMRRDII